MNNNLELIYWTNNGGVELPLEDWQYKVIAQVLGLSIQEDKNGNITFSHFPKDFVMKRMEKMGILIPVDGERKQFQLTFGQELWKYLPQDGIRDSLT